MLLLREFVFGSSLARACMLTVPSSQSVLEFTTFCLPSVYRFRRAKFSLFALVSVLSAKESASSSWGM